MGAVEDLTKINPEALLLDPRKVFDPALVGHTDEPKDHWPRTVKIFVAVYDEELCVSAIMEWLGCGEDEAWDWFEFNTAGAWAGPQTPTFTSRSRDADS